ncbi:MAG: AzlD domain-containing protein [Actinomycetota bacterium]
MSPAVVTMVVLAAITYALKSAAPLVLGGRALPARVQSMADLAPAALLGALVVVGTFAVAESLTVDARAVGTLAAGVALWRRAPFVVVVVVACAATALVRLAA